MVCLPTGAVVGASCVLFYQSGRRSRHPRVPSTGKASILSCEFLLFSRTNSRAPGVFFWAACKVARVTGQRGSTCTPLGSPLAVAGVLCRCGNCQEERSRLRSLYLRKIHVLT